MRHMTAEQAEARLSVGKPLELWLERKAVDGRTVLRWVRLRHDAEQGYVVTLFEAIETDRDRFDIYGLYAVERDENGAPQQVFGAGKHHAVESPKRAMALVVELGGALDRFVSDGLVQDEYLSLAGQ
jgi:hypothetical protein